MLGVRSHNEPVAGKYAEQLARDIIEMYSHPQENTTRGKYNFDWSEVVNEL